MSATNYFKVSGATKLGEFFFFHETPTSCANAYGAALAAVGVHKVRGITTSLSVWSVPCIAVQAYLIGVSVPETPGLPVDVEDLPS